MELNKDLISNIASAFGVTAEEFTAKITSEKQEELKLAGQLFTDDELQSRDSGKYNEGKEAQEEMLVKKAKKELGYEFEGKSFNQLLGHHEDQLKTKYSKNSDERVSELEKDIDNLKLTYTGEIDGYKNQLSDLSGKYKNQSTKNTLLSLMPKDTIISPEALVTLFKSRYDLDEENGSILVKQNGEVLKDPKTTDPLKIDSVFNDWLVKEKYIATTGGRGGGNEFGDNGFTGIKTPDQFQNSWSKQNPDSSTTSNKYQEDYAKWRETQKKTA